MSSRGVPHVFGSGEMPRRQPVQPSATGPYMDYGPAPPASYGLDQLRALPVQPNRVFVYWEMTGPGGTQARAGGATGRKWILRSCAMDSGATWDVAIGPDVGNYYLDVGDETAYRFEVGFVDAGAYTAVLRSETLKVPWHRHRVKQSEPVWAHVRRDVGPRGVTSTRRMPYPGGLSATSVPGLSYEATKGMITSPHWGLLGRSRT